MDLKRLFTIILQHNNSRDTIQLLKSIEHAEGFLNVILVDTGSDTEHLQAIRNHAHSRGLTLLETKDNLGYAGGNNIGIRYALKNGAEHVLLLNNDTYITDNALVEKLVAKIESDDAIGIVGPVIEESNRTVYGGEIRWLKSKGKHIQDSRLRRQDTRYYVPGSCMLVKKQVFDTIGLLPEEYFLYFEDMAFCIKTQHAGFACALAEDAHVAHTVSASTSKLGAPLLLYYHYRNALYFNHAFGPWWAKTLVYPWSIIILVKQLIKRSAGKDKEKSQYITKGVLDFYKRKMGKT